MVPSFRTRASCSTNFCDRLTVKGISSGVSLQANPTIMPWSPAPVASMASSAADPRCSKAVVTPALMSGDCSWMETITPQLVASMP